MPLGVRGIYGRNMTIWVGAFLCDHIVVGPQAITAEQTLVFKATENAEDTIYAGSPARKIGNTEENIGGRSVSGSRPRST